MLLSFLFILYTYSIQIDNLLEVESIDITSEEIEENVESASTRNIISTIIEVEGNPETHRKYIETYFPTIEVVATYDKLFNGLALKGRSDQLVRLTDLDFVKGLYPVQVYTTLHSTFISQSPLMKQPYLITDMNVFAQNRRNIVQQGLLPQTTSESYLIPRLQTITEDPNIVFPNQLNTTEFTGKGIKVGVVDTGLDFNHPDLVSNYRGGFDLVDLDDEPMETTEEEGVPTNHGTHVAGIIAANGEIKGVAPEAEIYAYRALGPGGFGTSIQVIAAMEEAVKDGVDIINLSLGNTINGPDYPTSKAVNEAVKHGVIVVVANGNAGPNDWTIGSPATAPAAFSVGAYQQSGFVSFLYDPKSQKNIQLSQFSFSKPWHFTRDYEVVSANNRSLQSELVRDKIGLFKQGDKLLADQLKAFEHAGGVAAIIYGVTPQNQQWIPPLREIELDIPIAQISNQDGRWLEKTIQEQTNLYFKNIQEKSNQTIANFSSRGPVTVNWMLKPDIIAPGVNILSTVPGGYDMLNGTSMAAPHVAGAIAVVKEAKPNWTNEQILGALRTTAKQIETVDGNKIAPIIQGAGLINIARAINTDTIIDNPLLSFGKIGDHVEERTVEVTIENISDQSQSYFFDVPKKQKGHSWRLPKTFTIDANSKKTVPITLKVNTLQLEKGTYQDWLTLNSGGKSYSLPYLFISETANYPRIMGFSFKLSSTDKRKYQYQFYAAEQVKSVRVQLYEPHSLVNEGTLLTLTDVEVGMNEGEIRKDRIEQRGRFHGIIIIELNNGELINYATEIVLE